jgi:phosphatidylglycerol:prolipoprotein diacylglycerol transferase
MHPVLFHIGHLTFYSFGLMAALALLVPGFAIILPVLRRQQVEGADSRVFEIVVAAGVGGFVGARIYYLVQHWTEVKSSLGSHLVSGSGFTWYGGLIGGFLLVVLVMRLRKVPLGLVANAVAPSLAAGYAIGRIGCQLSGDGDYGKVSHFHTWLLAEAYPHGTVPTPPGIRVYPTPIYEIVVMLMVAWVLYRMARKVQPGWYVFGWFLILSGVERFAIEFIRRNPVIALGLRAPQWVALGSIAIGAVVVYVTRKRPAVRAPARLTRQGRRTAAKA